MEKAKKTEITKERIMQAAMTEFGTKGYAAASLNNICSTGISKGLLYHNFENKDALYLACIKQCFEQLTAYLQQHSTETTLSCYMDARLHFFQDNQHLAKLFFESMLQPPAHLEEEIKELQKVFHAFNQGFFQEILKTIRLRSAVTTTDAMEYFLLMQNAFHGIFNGSMHGTAPFSEIVDTHETSLSKFLDLLLYGIADRGEDT